MIQEWEGKYSYNKIMWGVIVIELPPCPIPHSYPDSWAQETHGIARTFTYNMGQEVACDPGVKCHVHTQSPEIHETKSCEEFC